MVCECGAPIHVCLVEEPLGKRVERGERERRAARNKNKNKISDESRGTRDEVRGAVRAALSHMQNYSKTTPRTPQPHLDFRISASAHRYARRRTAAHRLRTACAPPLRLCAPGTPLRTSPHPAEQSREIAENYRFSTRCPRVFQIGLAPSPSFHHLRPTETTSLPPPWIFLKPSTIAIPC